MPPLLQLDAGPLTIRQVCDVASRGHPVGLAPPARERLQRSRATVEQHVSDGRPHYGINTGFGSLSRQRIGPDDLRDLQRNLIRSHAAGVGESLPTAVVRAMMILLAASLARGISGVRPGLVELLVEMLNRGVTPIVPSLGSVGASGDLAPLAAIGLVAIGEGKAEFGGRVAPGGEALVASGLSPIVLEAKEGLAIINGTHLMAAQGALLCAEADRLIGAALAANAMAIDACRASDSYLDPRVYAARNQPGPAWVAEQLRGLLKGTQIVGSHKDNDPRVQDPYCLRCAPQVLGAARDCLGYVKQAIERELGAVTDNPLVLGQDVVSAGNFHGMPLAIPLDAAAIALSHVAGISERRTYWMLSAHDTESHLPPYLAKGAGLSSGLMIAQYVAAACCNEIVGLATPASVANLPTSAGIEDYNSFGPRSAAKARRAADLARTVIAIELMCAAEGLEYHRPLRSGTGVEHVYAIVRERVPRLEHDRPPGPDIEAIARAIEDGLFGLDA